MTTSGLMELLAEEPEEREYGSCYFCGAGLTRIEARYGDVCEHCFVKNEEVER